MVTHVLHQKEGATSGEDKLGTQETKPPIGMVGGELGPRYY